MTRKINYICKACGSDEVTFDATAEWDVEQQELIVSNTYDDCYCNSEECMGEERGIQEIDAETGEALGRAPGLHEYIAKAQADKAWEAYRQQREAESKERYRAQKQEKTIAENARVLAAAYEGATL